jgi:heme-degrading monooxygenase HmoA
MLAGTVPAARYPGSVGAMILEHALITVRPDSHEEFEAALVRAREVISAAPGFLSLRLSRGIESPDRYLLLVEWETLEDHTVGFRESERFAEWRSQIGPFFDSPPVVDHYTPVLA